MARPVSEADEEMPPEFRHQDAAELPLAEEGPVSVRALSGSAYGVRSSVRTLVDRLYLVAELKAAQHLALPNGGGERAIFPVSDSVSVEASPVQAREMAVLSSRTGLSLTARENSRLVLIGGSP